MSNIYITPCIKELINFKKDNSTKNSTRLLNCLRNFEDIYRKLNIELYVNPKNGEILFPDNQRIQASLNVYLSKIDIYSDSIKENNNHHEKLLLYNILLNDALRNKYNDFYYQVAHKNSLLPKKYGIDYLLNERQNEKGGTRYKKTKRSQKSKNKNYKKTKRRYK